MTREGILVFSGVHSCWSGCALQLVLETPGRRGTLTTTLGDPEKEAPSPGEKTEIRHQDTESHEFQNSEHVER